MGPYILVLYDGSVLDFNPWRGGREGGREGHTLPLPPFSFLRLYLSVFSLSLPPGPIEVQHTGPDRKEMY